MTINFTNRETYIQWVKEWKEAYAALSTMISELKTEIKAIQKSAGNDAASSKQSTREFMRRRANQMLATRAEAKVIAQQQYLAEREADKKAA